MGYRLHSGPGEADHAAQSGPTVVDAALLGRTQDHLTAFFRYQVAPSSPYVGSYRGEARNDGQDLTPDRMNRQIYYVSNIATYSATNGSLGAAIVLLLYLFISAVMVLLGAEVNAVVYRHIAKGENGTGT